MIEVTRILSAIDQGDPHAAEFKDAVKLKQGKDLRALCGRADFQKLLTGLEAGTKARSKSLSHLAGPLHPRGFRFRCVAFTLRFRCPDSLPGGHPQTQRNENESAVERSACQKNDFPLADSLALFAPWP